MSESPGVVQRAGFVLPQLAVVQRFGGAGSPPRGGGTGRRTEKRGPSAPSGTGAAARPTRPLRAASRAAAPPHEVAADLGQAEREVFLRLHVVDRPRRGVDREGGHVQEKRVVAPQRIHDVLVGIEHPGAAQCEVSSPRKPRARSACAAARGVRGAPAYRPEGSRPARCRRCRRRNSGKTHGLHLVASPPRSTDRSGRRCRCCRGATRAPTAGAHCGPRHLLRHPLRRAAPRSQIKRFIVV